MSTLKYLIIHCTATKEGKKVTSADIRHWHTSPMPIGKGWTQVGYTDMFHAAGGIERLVANNEDAKVDNWEVTNGATGYNGQSRHIVYVGGLDATGKPKDTRTAAQKQDMEKYVKAFLKNHPTVKVIGHNSVAAKDCPCFNVANWLSSIGIKQ